MDFETLQNIRDITKELYVIIQKFPKSEIYCLTSQIQRAFISIRLNLAEGWIYRDDRQKNFYTIALGSVFEVQECLKIAVELGYVTDDDIMIFYDKIEKTKAQLVKLLNYLKNR